MRERVNVDQVTEIAAAELKSEPLPPANDQAPEAAIVSTCNRTEIYCAGDASHLEHTLDWLAKSGGVSVQYDWDQLSPKGRVLCARSSLGEVQRFEREISVTLPPVFELFDPAIWQGRATFAATDPAPYRLVVREFERYYSDRSIPERHGNKVLQRRVVEERLVYTEFFPI